MFLLAEACNTTIYIQNKCLHRILEDKTHEQAFTGVKLDVSDFHIFGYLFYMHVPVEKRNKLDPSNRKGSFVGYIDTSTDYRVFIPYHRNTIISRDVNLKEDFSYINSHNHIPMIEDEEREAPKVEHGSPTTSSLW
jgi:hypothetical protein